jgi:hypothetical protein
VIVISLAAGLAAGTARAAETLEQALREADFIVDWRLRYESVEQGGFAQSADAVTSRLRAGLQTAPLGKTALQVEAVWLEDLVDDYNSTTNGQTEFPVVADPADFGALNRFALINKSLPATTLTFGRQRIVLDDSRFVGNVGWRQHEQTFDGIRAQLGGSAFKTDLSYSGQVNRVFGPDSPVGEWEGDFVLANVSRSLTIGTLTLFDYYVDTDDAAAISSNTIGARLAGSKPLGGLTGTYALSYARQTDAGANPASFDEDYTFVEGGLTLQKLGVALGVEVLGSDGVNAFVTPLATLHAFQGWADKFLATPAGGLQDRYLKLSYPIAKRGRFTSVNALAFFHDFDAEAGGGQLGQELDLQLVARTERLALTLKYSDYRAAALFTDTEKLWVSIDYAF